MGQRGLFSNGDGGDGKDFNYRVENFTPLYLILSQMTD
jgi:hypothetical protein